MHTIFFIFFKWWSLTNSRWRVCYQRGLPRLVFLIYTSNKLWRLAKQSTFQTVQLHIWKYLYFVVFWQWSWPLAIRVSLSTRKILYTISSPFPQPQTKPILIITSWVPPSIEIDCPYDLEAVPVCVSIRPWKTHDFVPCSAQQPPPLVPWISGLRSGLSYVLSWFVDKLWRKKTMNCVTQLVC